MNQIEINYDAGRLSNTYLPFVMSPLYGEWPKYPANELINFTVMKMGICDRIKVLNLKFQKLVGLYTDIKLNVDQTPSDSPSFEKLAITPTLYALYLSEVESIVFSIKRILDLQVQVTEFCVCSETLKTDPKIYFNGLGTIVNSSTILEGNYLIIRNIFLGDSIFEKDETSYLQKINDLFNSFKHSIAHEESRMLIGETQPTIVSYCFKRNDFSKDLVFHNHNAYHVMMGFEDTFKRILRNQEKFLNQSSSLLKSDME